MSLPWWDSSYPWYYYMGVKYQTQAYFFKTLYFIYYLNCISFNLDKSRTWKVYAHSGNSVFSKALSNPRRCNEDFYIFLNALNNFFMSGILQLRFGTDAYLKSEINLVNMLLFLSVVIFLQFGPFHVFYVHIKWDFMQI